MFKKIGSLSVMVLAVLLLIYSGSRSLNFIQMTLPPDNQILAFFGLAALDGGLIAWLLTYLNGSHGGWQRGIALIMVLVDFLGAFAMFTLDTLFNTGLAGMTAQMTPDSITVAVIGLSIVIGLNIAATVAHHLTDPDRLREQAEEEAKSRIEDQALRLLNENANQLAAQLAPQIAKDWMEDTASQYTTLLDGRKGRRSLPAPRSQPESKTYTENEVQAIVRSFVLANKNGNGAHAEAAEDLGNDPNPTNRPRR